MSNDSFFKCKRNEISREVGKKPAVLTILFHLAMMTPRTGPEENKWIKIDYLSLGLTRKQFRGAEEYIIRGQLGASRRANKGTWIKLISKTIFDINDGDEGQHQGQQRASLYIQEEEYNNKYTGTEEKKESIIASTLLDKTDNPFGMNVPASTVVKVPQRSPVEKALVEEAVKAGKTFIFSPPQISMLELFDIASVRVAMKVASQGSHSTRVPFSYFNKILERLVLEKGSVTQGERKKSEAELIAEFRKMGIGSRALPKLTTEKNV